jgi:hypothetical protein
MTLVRAERCPRSGAWVSIAFRPSLETADAYLVTLCLGPARACAAPEANSSKWLDPKPGQGKNSLGQQARRSRAGSSRYRGAASSRNPWAQSSRYRRSSRDEDCSPPPHRSGLASFSHPAPPEVQPVASADFALVERVAVGIGNGKTFIKRLNRSHVMPR